MLSLTQPNAVIGGAKSLDKTDTESLDGTVESLTQAVTKPTPLLKNRLCVAMVVTVVVVSIFDSIVAGSSSSSSSAGPCGSNYVGFTFQTPEGSIVFGGAALVDECLPPWAFNKRQEFLQGVETVVFQNTGELTLFEDTFLLDVNGATISAFENVTSLTLDYKGETKLPDNFFSEIFPAVTSISIGALPETQWLNLVDPEKITAFTCLFCEQTDIWTTFPNLVELGFFLLDQPTDLFEFQNQQLDTLRLDIDDLALFPWDALDAAQNLSRFEVSSGRIMDIEIPRWSGIGTGMLSRLVVSEVRHVQTNAFQYLTSLTSLQIHQVPDFPNDCPASLVTRSGLAEDVSISGTASRECQEFTQFLQDVPAQADAYCTETEYESFMVKSRLQMPDILTQDEFNATTFWGYCIPGYAFEPYMDEIQEKGYQVARLHPSHFREDSETKIHMDALRVRRNGVPEPLLPTVEQLRILSTDSKRLQISLPPNFFSHDNFPALTKLLFSSTSLQISKSLFADLQNCQELTINGSPTPIIPTVSHMQSLTLLSIIDSALINFNADEVLGLNHSTVHDITLFGNAFDHIPQLYHFDSLTRINLNANRIQSVKQEDLQFSPTSMLQRLFLMDNMITEIEDDAFALLPPETIVYLTGNPIIETECVEDMILRTGLVDGRFIGLNDC